MFFFSNLRNKEKVSVVRVFINRMCFAYHLYVHPQVVLQSQTKLWSQSIFSNFCSMLPTPLSRNKPPSYPLVKVVLV